MQGWALGTKREQTPFSDRNPWNKGWKNLSFHLEKIYTPTLGVAEYEILLVPLILLFHLQLCACGRKRPSENPQKHSSFHWAMISSASALHTSTNDYIGCPWLSEGCMWDKRGGRACKHLQPASCCWKRLLNTTEAATDSVRRRPVPQNPRSYLCAFLSGLSLCTNTLLLSHPRQQAPLLHNWAQTRPRSIPQWEGLCIGDGRSATYQFHLKKC